MSCSICRLPFTPFKSSVDPRPPPPGILNKYQNAYYQKAVGIGENIMGMVMDFHYTGKRFSNQISSVPRLIARKDNNVFSGGGVIIFCLTWESHQDGREETVSALVLASPWRV